MPIKYKIFEREKLVYVSGEGKITIDELLRHLEELSRDPEYRAPMKKLVDYRNTPQIGLSREDGQKFTDRKSLFKDSFQGERCAIVVANELDYGVSRVHSARIEPADIETNVFRNIHEALAWLKVDLDENELLSS